jgi:LemA protein
METSMSTRLLAVLAFVATLLSGCGYNQIQINDEGVNAAWSEVLNQYKRRADLIPNLVQTVQGYAAHEKEVLTRVTERAPTSPASRPRPNWSTTRPRFAKFQKAQGELSARCRGCWWWPRTIRSSRPTPISATCRRSSKAPRTASPSRATATSRAVQEYNISVRTFPNNLTAMVMGYKTKANFTVEDEKAIAEPPKVNFRSPPAAGTCARHLHPRRPTDGGART